MCLFVDIVVVDSPFSILGSAIDELLTFYGRELLCLTLQLAEQALRMSYRYECRVCIPHCNIIFIKLPYIKVC